MKNPGFRYQVMSPISCMYGNIQMKVRFFLLFDCFPRIKGYMSHVSGILFQMNFIWTFEINWEFPALMSNENLTPRSDSSTTAVSYSITAGRPRAVIYSIVPESIPSKLPPASRSSAAIWTRDMEPFFIGNLQYGKYKHWSTAWLR